ncbi:MAG: heme ABC exporter ATP-binding protein CcmA [Wenzhouxiangella sp.]
MSRLLEAREATFSRAGEPVFPAIDTDIESGEVIVVRGPNGCGKTTLLRMFAGILKPWNGTVSIYTSIAFLGHAPALKGELTCRENLEFQRRFHGAGNGPGTDRALARVGLAGLGLRPARALSAGQRRRLALAGLLVAPRSLWLLDEPYASLDDDGCSLVDRLLDEHIARGGGAAISTHQRQPMIATEIRQILLEPATEQTA